MEFVPLVAAGLSLALGVFGLVSPRGALRLVGLALDPARPEGVSEVRATYGGVFAGASAAALLLNDPAAHMTLGAGWLLAALARAASVLVDRAPLGANLPGIAFEGLIGAGLIVPWLL